MAGSPIKRQRREAARASSGVVQLGARLPVFPTSALGVPHSPRLPGVAARLASSQGAASPAGAPAVPSEQGPAGLPAAAAAPSSNGSAGAATPAAAAPPPPPPAAAPAPQWTAPPGSVDASATNHWRSYAQTRDQDAGIGAGLQADTLLIQQWAYVVLQRGVPPSACMLIIRRCEPAPMYDLAIPGDAVAVTQSGVRNPALALQEYLERNRRHPETAEYFRGRIQGFSIKGGNQSIEDLGGGDMSLSARAAAQPQLGTTWATPQGQPVYPGQYPAAPYGAPPYGYAAPGYPPQGYFPPYGMPGMGMPWPMMMGQPAAPPPAPPATADPNAMAMWKIQADAWKAQSDNQMTMMNMVLGRTQPPAADPMKGAQDILALARGFADMNRVETPAAPTFQVIKPDSDTTLIVQDGKIDAVTTAGIMAKDMVKGITGALRQRSAGSVAGGAQSPRVKQPPPATNGQGS